MVLTLLVLLFFDVSFGWYGILFLVFFLVTLFGSFSMSWNFHLKAFTSSKNYSEKKIAITFDDGPHPIFTSNVLKLLSDYDAKATFFCIGKHAELYPEVLKSIHDQGHLIGNHSFTHRYGIDFNKAKAWTTEISQTDTTIAQVTGSKPKLFRPPFGVTTPHLAEALKQSGHMVIGWNIRSYDTVLKNPNVILNRITKNVKPGAVILLHDNHDRIEFVLEQLLQFLKKQGYTMVTINEVLDET